MKVVVHAAVEGSVDRLMCPTTSYLRKRGQQKEIRLFGYERGSGVEVASSR